MEIEEIKCRPAEVKVSLLENIRSSDCFSKGKAKKIRVTRGEENSREMERKVTHRNPEIPLVLISKNDCTVCKVKTPSSCNKLRK